ncbi:cupredoxin domain-containing protein [Candidatus Nitrosocosmicus arcticus]|uniref:Blue (Type 1) copper domain protein n=1 Tax=Candidatus Nitrosocosmicus arcticus TaxID=2035267 RepID=A0A557SYX2_9ARCH|nr:hypothetical protein [Candidatus Nitrosocosmicus arcticus]TVP41806.1 exported protein of unknown function [Candidatus Nitrosocosmicus arcticus]
MIKILTSFLLLLTIFVGINSIGNLYAQGINDNNTDNFTTLDAETVYEQKNAVLGNDIKNFVILIPNEAHESMNIPDQLPLANQPYIPQTITATKGTAITWLNGDVDHDHTIKFKTPNPQNLAETESFASGEYTTINFNQTGQYSYFEDNVNQEDEAFIMEGNINMVDSDTNTQLNTNASSQPINTAGILMVPSKDSQSIISTLESEGITTLSSYTFTDIRGGQKDTGPTQTILVWGTQSNSIDQALSPIIAVSDDLPYS